MSIAIVFLRLLLSKPLGLKCYLMDSYLNNHLALQFTMGIGFVHKILKTLLF